METLPESLFKRGDGGRRFATVSMNKITDPDPRKKFFYTEGDVPVGKFKEKNMKKKFLHPENQ
jgi:hypothetical protein